MARSQAQADGNSLSLLTASNVVNTACSSTRQRCKYSNTEGDEVTTNKRGVGKWRVGLSANVNRINVKSCAYIQRTVTFVQKTKERVSPRPVDRTQSTR